MGHTPSKMPSVQGSLQRLALAGAVLLPAPATSLTASTLMEKSECEIESIASTSTASVEEEESNEDKLISILNDSLISEKILSHLTVRDMKAASQVNSTFRWMVRGSLCFQQKVILVVPKNAVGVEEVLENTSLTCVEGVVDLSASLRTVQLLSQKTKELIIRTETKTNFWLRMKQLTKLLKDSPELKLKALFVDIREFKEFSPVVSELVEFLDVLTNSESLCISDSSSCNNYDDLIRGNRDYSKYDAVALMNLKPTNGTSRSQKLKSFIAAIDPEYSHPVALEVIGEILKRHKETLEVFCCYYNTWTLDFLKTTRMPLLNVLFVEDVDAADEQVFIGFLQGLETLKDLRVVVNGKLSKSLLAAIEKRSSKLTRLHISADDFSEVCTKDDWSFLGPMELLKDFSITVRVRDKESYEMELIVTTSLPPKQLRDFSLRGAWKDGGDFEQQNASYDLWMSSWKGFQCLRSLSLNRCWNSIDDTFMQMILSECRELQELLIEYCPELTVGGFTGISHKVHPNLKSLSIKYCKEIQLKNLVSTDAFRNLKSLEYIPTGMQPARIPDDIASLLILKNPRLETICVPLKSDNSAERIKGNVKAWASNHPLREVTCGYC